MVRVVLNTLIFRIFKLLSKKVIFDSFHKTLASPLGIKEINMKKKSLKMK